MLAMFLNTGQAYVITGRNICLYSKSLFVEFNLDFLLSSEYSIFIIFEAFSVIYWIWCRNVNVLSNISPRYFTCDVHSIELPIT